MALVIFSAITNALLAPDAVPQFDLDLAFALHGTPSGQALGSLVGYGMVAYFLILIVRGHRTRIAIAVAMSLLVLSICFGRLYLGDRYFSDIVSGLAAGGVWLSACLTGLEVARRKGEMSERRSTLSS